MFKLFAPKEKKCPISEDRRIFIESALPWLFNTFGEEFCQNQQVFTSVKELLNHYQLEKASLDDIGTVVAQLMSIDFNKVELEVYEEGEETLDIDGNPIYIETEEEEQTTGGLYLGKNENGKFEVGIERSVLRDPVNLVFTLAHEFAHIKLLGEEKITENDEHLTDLTPLVFGLGVFGAASVFSFNQTPQGWAHRSSGYLTQMEWGYALAVYAHLREEEAPEWVAYLPKNVQADFKRSVAFMLENETQLFKEKW